jgi:hypothetical protein
MSRITDIASRYYKDERLCQVSYAISLDDGRVVRLDVPESREYTETQARENARQQAEEYMAKLFTVEHRTGRYTCCNGMVHYKAAGHRPDCPAYR